MRKKEKILNAAISLFAHQEYAGVSSLQIAQKAGVSDALIFKHFSSKKNLFEQAIKKCHQNTEDYFLNQTDQSSAKNYIKTLIDCIYNIEAQNEVYFLFLLRLKLHNEYANFSIFDSQMEKTQLALNNLNYNDAEKEAQLLLFTISALLENLLTTDKTTLLQYKYYLIHKYTL